MPKIFMLDDLRSHSGLPGPRANLTLLHTFATHCDASIVAECLAVIRDDIANSPDEFVGMCGVLGFALLNWQAEDRLLLHLRTYSTHASWRLRETVAIAIQELPVATLTERLRITSRLESPDPFVHRAIVAGLCEPKNLKQTEYMPALFAQLYRSTQLIDHDRKLQAGEETLRKALGYAWSVAVVAAPDLGKPAFEQLFALAGKHVRWIIAENLKKHRLTVMDQQWTALCQARLAKL